MGCRDSRMRAAARITPGAPRVAAPSTPTTAGAWSSWIVRQNTLGSAHAARPDARLTPGRATALFSCQRPGLLRPRGRLQSPGKGRCYHQIANGKGVPSWSFLRSPARVARNSCPTCFPSLLGRARSRAGPPSRTWPNNQSRDGATCPSAAIGPAGRVVLRLTDHQAFTRSCIRKSEALIRYLRPEPGLNGRMMFCSLVNVNRPLVVSQFDTQTRPLGESKGARFTCPRMLMQQHQSARFAMCKWCTTGSDRASVTALALT